MSKIEVADKTAEDLADRAKRLGMSVADLVDAMASQFISDADSVFDLTDEQMEQIRRNVEDPAPSVPHDQVVASIDRLIARKK